MHVPSTHRTVVFYGKPVRDHAFCHCISDTYWLPTVPVRMQLGSPGHGVNLQLAAGANRDEDVGPWVFGHLRFRGKLWKDDLTLQIKCVKHMAVLT